MTISDLLYNLIIKRFLETNTKNKIITWFHLYNFQINMMKVRIINAEK
jgi:hypothetical protein